MLFNFPLFYEALGPWLLLVWLFLRILKKAQWYRPGMSSLCFIGLGVTGVLVFSFHGLSVARWVASFDGNFSIPLLGILAIAIIEESFSVVLFAPRDWKATWFFGAIATIVLYPSALGLGSIDVYSWGWGAGILLLSIALITAVLLWRENRFGILLLLALAASTFHVQGSTNLWDYIIDPAFGVLSIVMVGVLSFFRIMCMHWRSMCMLYHTRSSR